ncbi:fibronectin type III domain protein [Clostridium sp. CAG:277]|nr:fibronectin type III domain protein [Clostridium sp. CAG:277]
MVHRPGYEIQYGTSSGFEGAKTVTVSKNKTTGKTISKLKAKKKYYVRIRAYKTVKVKEQSVKIYSSWSKVRKIKVK